MRSVNRPRRVATVAAALLGALLSTAGCAATGPALVASREMELTYDDGHPSQQPILPPGNFELLMKAEPNLPSYRPLRLRFLLAQPGRLVLHLYESGADGRPGKLLYTVDREYPPDLCSGASDGKSIIENLPELPDLHGPAFVGIGLSDPASGARLWVTDNDSGHVYQRDQEPGTALLSSTVHYTPMVRLVIAPH